MALSERIVVHTYILFTCRYVYNASELRHLFTQRKLYYFSVVHALIQEESFHV